MMRRREFLLGAATLAASALARNANARPSRDGVRRFHCCISAHALDRYPEMPAVAARAGITDVWMASFLYGHWYRTPEQLRAMAPIFEAHGMRTHAITVPLGHPGNALGVEDEGTPVSPPMHWKMAQRPEGATYSGTSIHDPAPEENATAVRALARAGFREAFLDDDFRIAASPGQIGGCFCPDCRDDFLHAYGFSEGRFEELIDNVSTRTPGPVLRAWVEYGCGKLMDMLELQQRAAPAMDLGIMVMYLGSEKAGIPLDRLGGVPFRVGELMFDDRSFGSAKGKTDELFSALFHRRFARPEDAYSESTAFPADQLSAANLAAKLTVSLIADVRHTMFMSGLWPFPIEHWDTLGPAMAESARLHGRIAGHRLAGPLKHFHGEDERLVGDDNPFSLFLAMGIPFEVVDELPTSGWAFLGNADARAVRDGRLKSRGRRLYSRPGTGAAHADLTPVAEDLGSIMELKRGLIPQLRGIPYVAGEIPVVLAWYPAAGCAILWNLTESRQQIAVCRDAQTICEADLPPLGVRLVEGVGLV